MWSYYGLWITARFIAPLPERVGLLIIDAFSVVNSFFARRSRAALEANLRRVLGPSADRRRLRRIARRSFLHMGRNYYDLVRIPRLPSESVRARIEFRGLENMEAARQRGAGVVVASAHLGNLDLVIQAAPLLDIDLVVLSEQLRPKRLHDLTMRLRTTKGIAFVPADAGGIKAAFRALHNGDFVALACDRLVHGSGMTLDFFGEATEMPVGAADLALRTGATLLPAFSLRTGRNRYALCFDKPVPVTKRPYGPEDVRDLANRVIVVMERYIRDNPDQWMAFQRIWGRSRPVAAPARDSGEAVGTAA